MSVPQRYGITVPFDGVPLHAHREWFEEIAALGDALTRLRWYAWDGGGAATGWGLHLAIEDRTSGRSWAVAAIDLA